MAAHPRWYQALTKALSLPENKTQNVYQIATVDANGTPHVRSLIHRGFIFPNALPSVPLLLTTTDVRTPKVTQLLSNPNLEVAWWIEGSQDQFRIAGKATVVPSPDHPLHAKFKPRIGSALAQLSDEGEQGRSSPGKYDWEAKRRETFDSMSAHMKATWLRPPPGSVLQSYDDPKPWPKTVPKLGEAESEEEKKLQQDALGNFALVVIEPSQVDWVQLAEKPNRRTFFVRSGEGDWKEEIQVP
ncbi:hypothetical protein K474DRAFT_828606 [Panus rudis PR-1116 ss-1]|nr:hypothetical protein K474DRAFT_828606 [Panus rudis PR-1116 ss-1]